MLLGEETWDRPELRPRSHKRDDGRDPLWSRPSLLDCPLEIEMGYQSLPTQACILSHHHTAKNVWKSRSKNQQESEKVAEIFVRKSREKIATRYNLVVSTQGDEHESAGPTSPAFLFW